ncbi:MAG: YkgJ family cysteine cluster protein [Geovibrio sp.]|nr:YkgJ family cysteine cluster protein [Geovibrio sp.]
MCGKPDKPEIKCLMCGTCCIAFDISVLGKEAGVPCAHLTADKKCGIYEDRPWGCKGYKPDELCVLFSTLSEEERVRLLRKIYGV